MVELSIKLDMFRMASSCLKGGGGGDGRDSGDFFIFNEF